MDRLTFEAHDGGMFVSENNIKICSVEDEIMYTGNAIFKLAEYEEAGEQGLLLRLPCPIGTTVYFINYHEDDDCGHYEIASGIFNYSWLDFPRKFYLTKEEANQALKQMGE